MYRIIIVTIALFAWVNGNSQYVQNFTLTNVLNEQPVSLDTYPSCSGLVIIFTSNACPYDEHYRARIVKLAGEYHDKVPVILVNANNESAESIDNMKKKAQLLGLTIPYLADKDQKLMQQLGATKSPQAFLLKNTGGKFTVVYSGAIDDNAQVEGDVRHAYLKDAIDILLSNQTIATPEIRPVGCTIRKK
jgi:peroxiredoxin